MSTREFRTAFHTVTEPVEVLKGVETVGFFYPGDQMPIVHPTWSQPLMDTPVSVPGGDTGSRVTPGLAPRSTTTPPAQQRFGEKRSALKPSQRGKR